MIKLRARRLLHYAVPLASNGHMSLETKYLFCVRNVPLIAPMNGLGRTPSSLSITTRNLSLFKKYKLALRSFLVLHKVELTYPQRLLLATSCRMFRQPSITCTSNRKQRRGFCFRNEGITPSHRATIPETNDAMKLEIKNLLPRGTFRVILKEESASWRLNDHIFSV